ncbi:molybdenum cofactor biosynthesis protein MoaE [Bradyrhizobium sp. AUGA SZCCT0177]|uniref:molybdenum cofactor biosynthesis protein MoaE n=1 Tax=Bradyrhizobium sp. AUGA SZCCT0177 TaxID=2807665 RepID=UPI001BAB2472|nr:molybdenum cofactor biosynthesis protein MoaE [Bradyrhizobium sp. AUGA SZCCT0177]MBR1281517.1 molybdenum cofactor biosynthesis protein MoaE [Bradyrhizobium sp. AUGA SZCCT0177]
MRAVHTTIPITIRLQQDDFDVSREIRSLTRGRTDIGALVSFNGICRGGGEGGIITGLTLEHYPGMAYTEIRRHVDEAITRWPLTGVTVIHRYGRLAPGDNIVLVLTASAHRQAAFLSAEFLMDYLKVNAPFWKSEQYARGASWVDSHGHDDDAIARWNAS